MTRADLDAFVQRLRARGFDESTVAADETGTLFTPLDATPKAEARLDGSLRVLTGTPPELRILGEIGRGGMGRIDAAEQVPLRRRVAVKQTVAKPSTRHEAREALLREAIVTGALEHPNVVPVHALGSADDGEVLLVMKHIEGTVWRKLLPAVGLERNLEILMDVCRAVHFAHDKGVLHRDLKPDNVMVGSFGEVYVLDWGLAVTFGPMRMQGVVHVSELVGLTGTPAYMAPEMVFRDRPLDARTDVYLLGAVLHELVTGAPPHTGAGIAELLLAADTAEPPRYDEGVPSELAAICTRALAREPRDRFASADELRLALAAYLKHAGARALVREANERLAELKRAIEQRGDDVTVHRAFGEARFGFRQALVEHPTSDEAKRGLAEALVVMARFEIGRRHADSARVLVAEMEAPPDDVTRGLARLDDELAEEARQRAELDRVRAASDVRPAQRLRGAFLLAVSAVWGLATLLHRLEVVVMDAAALLTLSAGVLVAVPATWFALPTLRQNEANRRLGVLTTMTALVLVLAWTLVWLGGLEPWVGLALTQLFLAMSIGSTAVTMDHRLAAPASVIALGFVLILAWPSLAYELNALVGTVAFSLLVWVWRARR